MRGVITVKVDRYQVADSLSMTLKACDAGAMFLFESPSVKTKTMIVIDERGNMVLNARDPSSPGRSAFPATRDAAEVRRPSSKTLAVARLPDASWTERARKRKSSRIRFSILFSKKARPKSHAFVLAAFMDGMETHILYRVEAAGITYYENQLMIAGDEICIGDDVPAKSRVKKEDWSGLIALPEQTFFHLHGEHKEWRKMCMEEMKLLISGQTYRLSNE